MFDFFKSCIVVACGNYFKTIVNVPFGTMYIHAIMPHVHISTTHYGMHLQLVFIMIPINTISLATSASLLKYYYSTML
jgi:hypothetical protein